MGDDHRPDPVAACTVPASLSGVADRQRLRYPAGKPGRRAARPARRGAALGRSAVVGTQRDGLDDGLAGMAEQTAASGMDTTRAARMEHSCRHVGCIGDPVAARLSPR